MPKPFPSDALMDRLTERMKYVEPETTGEFELLFAIGWAWRMHKAARERWGSAADPWSLALAERVIRAAQVEKLARMLKIKSPLGAAALYRAMGA